MSVCLYFKFPCTLKLHFLSNYFYTIFFFSVMSKIISNIRRNNLTDPLKKLAIERNKLRGNDLSHSHSLYRDILFLTITAIGRENIDISKNDILTSYLVNNCRYLNRIKYFQLLDNTNISLFILF